MDALQRGDEQREATAQCRENSGVVFVVDDDPEVREYVRWLLESRGFTVRAYDDPAAFLESFTDTAPSASCLVTDLRMPGLSGLDVQSELAARNIELPLIMISAYAEVSSAVQAMREGAVDFLEKPFDGEALVERVSAALAANREARQRSAQRAEVAAAMARLTPRQRVVLEGLTEGKPSKIIAAELGVSPRTVDVHRFRLMHALGAQSLPDLFRLVMLVR
jgi:two-component system response regulator FixJ